MIGIPVAVFQRFDSSFLGGAGGAHGGVLVDLRHRSNDRWWGTGIPDPESSHGKGFGTTIQEHGSFSHPGQRSNRNMLGSVINQLRMDFV